VPKGVIKNRLVLKVKEKHGQRCIEEENEIGW
jgi:hypothetical protein